MVKLSVITLALITVSPVAASAVASSLPAQVGWWDKDKVEGYQVVAGERRHSVKPPIKHERSPSYNRWNIGIGTGFYDPWYRPDWRWRNDRWGWNIGWGNQWGWPVTRWSNPYYNMMPLRPVKWKARRVHSIKDGSQNAQPMYKPQRQTASSEYSKGLNYLPANAKVIFKDGRYVYQWQNTLYYLDWQSQQYLPINHKNTQIQREKD